MRSFTLFFSLAVSSAILAAGAIKPFNLPWVNTPEAGARYWSQDVPAPVFVFESYFNTCPYCNDNAENVDELQQLYANQSRVQILDLGIDKKDEDYKEWIRKHEPNHPVLKDSSLIVTRQLGTTAYPTTYVVDCRGKVHLKTTGVWNAATKTQIRAKIDELLQKPCWL